MFVHYDGKNEDRINRLDAKNEQAHAGITDNVKALRSGQDAIACDVPFLAGRQAERDQQGARGADGTAR